MYFKSVKTIVYITLSIYLCFWFSFLSFFSFISSIFFVFVFFFGFKKTFVKIFLVLINIEMQMYRSCYYRV